MQTVNVVNPQYIRYYYMPISSGFVAPIYTPAILYQQFQPSMVMAHQNQLQSMMNVNYLAQPGLYLQQLQALQIAAGQLQLQQIVAGQQLLAFLNAGGQLQPPQIAAGQLQPPQI